MPGERAQPRHAPFKREASGAALANLRLLFRKRRASSVRGKKERKTVEEKKKKKDGCFETKAGAILYFIESLPGSGFNFSRVKKVFFFFFSPLKTRGGARVKELSLK